MKRTLVARVPASLILLAAMAIQAGAVAPALAGPGEGGNPKPDPTVEKPLFWQSDYDQAFHSTQEPSRDSHDSQAADEFTVPKHRTWKLTRVVAHGAFNGGVVAARWGNPTSNVFIYANEGTLPGTELRAFKDLPGVSNTGSVYATLPEPVILGPGTYWISVQVNLDFVPYGAWYWRTGFSNADLHKAVWRNPADGFGSGCVEWSTIGSCSPTFREEDLAFILHGFES